MRIRYILEVTTKHLHGTERFSIFYKKCYGDFTGGARGVEDEEEALKDLRGIIKRWDEYDLILHRQSDPVTTNNLEFNCCIPGITKEHILRK